MWYNVDVSNTNLALRAERLIKLGKNKRSIISYGAEEVSPIGEMLKRIAEELERKELPPMKLELEGLHKAIQMLPKEKRKKVEAYWGLTGGVDHSQRKLCYNDIALKNMMQEILDILQDELMTIDYLYLFDKSSRDLINKIMAKVDRNQTQLTNQEAIKYVMAFVVFFINGPKMAFEEDDNQINKIPEEYILHEYAMIQSIWLDYASELPDKSINLKLLVETVEHFNWKQVVAILDFSKIQVNKEERPTQVETLETLGDVRRFKEKFFPYGAWETTTCLVMEKDQMMSAMSEFFKELENLREDFGRIYDFKSGTYTIMTTKGTRNLDVYTIGGVSFTDPEEIIFLYSVLS